MSNLVLTNQDGSSIPLSRIAILIRKDWKNVSPHAEPYLQAMQTLNSINDNFFYDNFFYDTAKSVVLYFLSNASSWKGEIARQIKAHLKSISKG